MSMDKGWIKIYRDISDNWVFTDPIVFRAWIDILMMANHAPSRISVKRHMITINTGEFWTSIRKLSVRWGVSKDTTLKVLKSLKSDEMIDTEKLLGAGTLIKVRNYNKYQGLGGASQDTESYTESYTSQDATSTSGATLRGHSLGHSFATNKKEEELKKDKEGKRIERNNKAAGAAGVKWTRRNEYGVPIDENGLEI